MIHFDLRLLEPLPKGPSRFKHVHRAACGASRAKQFGWVLGDVTCKKCLKTATQPGAMMAVASAFDAWFREFIGKDAYDEINHPVVDAFRQALREKKK